MKLLTELTDGLSSDAIVILEFIGALNKDSNGEIHKYCLYNLGPILEEVDNYILPEMIDTAESFDLMILDEKLTNGLNLLKERIQHLKVDSDLRSLTCPDLNDRKLMQGYMVDFPLYSLIPYVPSDITDREKFRRYKGAIILAANELKLHAVEKNKNYTSALKSASAALRLMTESPLFSHLPKIQNQSLQEIYEEFESGTFEGTPTLAPTEIEYIRAITTVFRFTSEKTGGGLRRKSPREIEVDTSEGQSNISIRSVRATKYSTPDLRVAKKSGLALAELASDTELITQHSVKDDDLDESALPDRPAQSLARQALSRQRQLEGIEKGAQLLPFATNRLTPGELAVFFENTEKAAGKDLLDLMKIEAAAVLQTAFWLSKKLQESLHLIIYANHTNLPKVIPNGFIGYLQNSKEWVVPAIKPKGAPRHKGVDLSAAVPVQDFIRLPDVGATHKYLCKLSAWERSRFSKEGVRAFMSNGIFIVIACQDILKSVKNDTHGRVTFARLKDSVFMSLLDECQDKATAILTLARPHRLGDTQLHYSTVPTRKLRQIYLETSRNIVTSILFENESISLESCNLDIDDFRYESSDDYVGCPIRPTEESMSKIAKELALAIEYKRHPLIDAQSRVDYFNLYTSYTIFLLWHLTGIRAVSNPIPVLDCIDFDNSLLLASDKDDYTCFNTRLVPLVSVLLQQLKYYLFFQDNYIKNYFLQYPKRKTKFKHKLLKANSVFYFIQLNDGIQYPVEASPSAVMDQVRKISPWFGLPENCQRPRLRSFLLERDCPAQWVDALLGHWTRGEEPWHRFASTSQFRITQGLKGYLEEIASLDGWKAIKGGVI